MQFDWPFSQLILCTDIFSTNHFTCKLIMCSHDHLLYIAIYFHTMQVQLNELDTLVLSASAHDAHHGLHHYCLEEGGGGWLREKGFVSWVGLFYFCA